MAETMMLLDKAVRDQWAALSEALPRVIRRFASPAQPQITDYAAELRQMLTTASALHARLDQFELRISQQ